MTLGAAGVFILSTFCSRIGSSTIEGCKNKVGQRVGKGAVRFDGSLVWTGFVMASFTAEVWVIDTREWARL